jgi:DMSO/TMAO reductase YedYZ molybdopterin-dependent catalytic subunit
VFGMGTGVSLVLWAPILAFVPRESAFGGAETPFSLLEPRRVDYARPRPHRIIYGSDGDSLSPNAILKHKTQKGCCLNWCPYGASVWQSFKNLVRILLRDKRVWCLKHQ